MAQQFPTISLIIKLPVEGNAIGFVIHDCHQHAFELTTGAGEGIDDADDAAGVPGLGIAHCVVQRPERDIGPLRHEVDRAAGRQQDLTLAPGPQPGGGVEQASGKGRVAGDRHLLARVGACKPARDVV